MNAREKVEQIKAARIEEQLRTEREKVAKWARQALDAMPVPPEIADHELMRKTSNTSTDIVSALLWLEAQVGK